MFLGHNLLNSVVHGKKEEAEGKKGAVDNPKKLLLGKSFFWPSEWSRKLSLLEQKKKSN